MDCPYCSQPGAKRVLFKVRCPNAACPAYDSALAAGRGKGAAGNRPGVLTGGTDPMGSRSPGFPLDPFGMVLDLLGIGCLVLWVTDIWAWGLPLGILLIVVGTGLTVARLLRRVRGGDSPMEPATIGAPAPVPGSARALPWGGISWVLWIAAYGLFRFGQQRESARGALFVLAALTAVAAFVAGRRAAASGEARDDDAEDDNDDLKILRRAERDEREGPFDPSGERRIDVRYRNAAGEDKTFTGDRASLRRSKAHISLRVAPEGIRIALHPDRIANRAEVEGALPS